jgi:hypothetical protein
MQEAAIEDLNKKVNQLTTENKALRKAINDSLDVIWKLGYDREGCIKAFNILEGVILTTKG